VKTFSLTSLFPDTTNFAPFFIRVRVTRRVVPRLKALSCTSEGHLEMKRALRVSAIRASGDDQCKSCIKVVEFERVGATEASYQVTLLTSRSRTYKYPFKLLSKDNKLHIIN
jgi:hypothetical protein